MGHEAEIDLRNAGTSHAILAELVGPDRRVLDVGCAAGDLGRVLKQRGCRVVGVEPDPAAAEAARGVLDEVLTGDVAELDLVGRFGKATVDVVVFADVLGHVADPVAALRRVRPLLVETGSIVASIPNVAHGSVRLALLLGRFDDRPLDPTHLRFFTLESVYETFRAAGLAPVDVRRTTVGVFDTGLGLRREDFDEGVVDAVEGDPESTTHRFVLRAVPEDSPAGLAAEPVAPPAGHGATTRVGLCADWDPDDRRTALAVRVVHAELARRLPRAAIRTFSSAPGSRPSPHDGGLAVEALGAWTPDRAARLASELDCAVVTGDVAGPGDQPAPEVFGAGADCPVVWSAVRRVGEPLDAGGPAYGAVVSEGPAGTSAAPVETVPDPLLLVARVLPADALGRRLAYLRMMGWFPAEGPAVVVEAGASLLRPAAAVARALDAAASGTGAAVVLVAADTGGAPAADAVAAAMATPAYRIPADALVDDAVAAIAHADALYACSPAVTSLGLAYGVPVARIDAAADPPLPRPEGPAAGAVGAMQSELDAHFDRVAAVAEAAAAARPRPAGCPAVPAAEQAAARELAHRRMRERLATERLAVADHLARHQDELGGLRAEARRLAAERDDLASHHDACVSELRRVRAELDALHRTRLLRLLRPARAVYARLRGGRL